MNQASHSRELEDFRAISHRIFFLALRGLLRIEFLREVSKILIEFSGSDSIEIWLQERKKYFRSEFIDSAKNPFQVSIMATTKTKNKGIIPKLRKDLHLGSLCRDILLDRLNPQQPFITKKESFWLKDSENSTEDLKVKGNYRSFILIPISVENKKIGIIQLKSVTPNFFTKEDVEFYENIIEMLGIALTLRRAQIESRERVKELTCLYGIAKLAENPNLSLSEILQGIVQLLPPAWLYPDIASGRIILDERAYKSIQYQEGVHRQKADIIVGGENRGFVEVVYSKERIELDEGPFLKEERNLIDTIAREIALIVERKQTEEDKQKLQEQLRHADRLATIGQLSAGVAHELNEPISSILGFAQLIEKYPNLSEPIKRDIEKILKASLHAREVVKKLMIFARQMPPQKTRVNLNQIVQEGLYFLESRCAKDGIDVVRVLSSDLPEVTADPSQMTQVLVNLVVNAIQAMQNGGVLTIKTGVSGKNVLLSVEDTGVGMSERVKKQIFLPFFTTKDIGQGTGLGMSVVHGIINSHGGQIEVESKEGSGTKFEIKLPRID